MYDELKLDNGLSIIAEKIPHFRSVSVGLWLNVGSQHEQPQESGLSHFLEHMLFKGTEKRSARKIAEDIDGVGGQLNAFTSKECTCYYAKVMDEHLPLAMDVLCDMLRNAKLDEVEVNKEKGVILEEISMVEDSPEDVVHELLNVACFGDHALARPILGSAKNIGSFSNEDLKRYKTKMYCPQNTVLSVAGNYDWDKLVALANEFLGDWKCESDEPNIATPATMQQNVLRKDKDTEQLHICIAFPGVKQGSKDVYPISIFNNLFGGAMSSRLFQKIREEKGMAYSVYSYPTSLKECGTLAIYAGTNPDNANEVMNLIKIEIDEILKNGITDAEFMQTREQLKGSYILGLESASSRMTSMGRRKLLMGNTITEDEVIKLINETTIEDVYRVMNDSLKSPCSMAFVGKGASKVDVSMFC